MKAVLFKVRQARDHQLPLAPPPEELPPLSLELLELKLLPLSLKLLLLAKPAAV